MRALLAIAIVAPLVLAGCSDGKGSPPPAPGPVVEGWVVDPVHAPIAGANVVVQGLAVNATTDAEGHFTLAPPSGVDLLVTAAAPGFVAESQLLPAFSGSLHVLNFSLERVPVAEPYHLASVFDGVVSCGFTVA